MKKIFPVFLFFFFACSSSDEYDKAKVALALVNHSYYQISPQRAQELSSEISKLKTVDANAGLVAYKSLKVEKARSLSPVYPIIFSVQDGKIYAAKVFDFSVAYEAGLKSGCEILRINDKPASQLAADFREVEALMKEGKSFRCQYSCGGEPAFVDIKKELAYFPFVWNIAFSSQTAYVRINNFSRSSSVYIKNNLTNLKNSGRRKLIIDLRDLSGGDYEEAASFLNLFLPKDVAVFETKSDKKGYAKTFYTSNEPSFANFKLAILINSKTASLGEIAAEVLKEKAGAFLIGEKTAGKFFITKIFKVGAKNGLRLTVAKLNIPGTDLNEGFNPDVLAKDYLSSSQPSIFRAPFFVEQDPAIMAALSYFSNLK